MDDDDLEDTSWQTSIPTTFGKESDKLGKSLATGFGPGFLQRVLASGREVGAVGAALLEDDEVKTYVRKYAGNSKVGCLGRACQPGPRELVGVLGFACPLLYGGAGATGRAQLTNQHGLPRGGLGTEPVSSAGVPSDLRPSLLSSETVRVVINNTVEGMRLS